MICKWLKMGLLCGLLCSLHMSCKHDITLPMSLGTLNDVVVVMDEALWKGPAGEKMRTFLKDTIPWSTLSETRFDVSHISHESFESYKRCRNIITVNLDPTMSRSGFSAVENRWARPQLILSLVAPSRDSLLAAIDRYAGRMVSYIETKERRTLQDVYAHGSNPAITEYFAREHQVELKVPRVYTLDVSTPEFVWMSREERILSLGIFFWSYPYTDTLQLTLDALLAKRNEMTMAHVPGPIDSSYMVVEDYIPPVMQAFEYKGRYCIRLNGWWRTEKAFMGGPFESIVMIDEARGRILTLDGFVYHPQEPKRDYLTQLDAIMLSMAPLPVPDKEKQ